METGMHPWYLSDEFEMPLWVRDLDDDVYHVTHRRLCVWCDELTGTWCWEIVTYEHAGLADRGIAASEQDAKNVAEAAARRMAFPRSAP